MAIFVRLRPLSRDPPLGSMREIDGQLQHAAGAAAWAHFNNSRPSAKDRLGSGQSQRIGRVARQDEGARLSGSQTSLLWSRVAGPSFGSGGVAVHFSLSLPLSLPFPCPLLLPSPPPSPTPEPPPPLHARLRLPFPSFQIRGRWLVTCQSVAC